MEYGENGDKHTYIWTGMLIARNDIEKEKCTFIQAFLLSFINFVIGRLSFIKLIIPLTWSTSNKVCLNCYKLVLIRSPWARVYSLLLYFQSQRILVPVEFYTISAVLTNILNKNHRAFIKKSKITFYSFVKNLVYKHFKSYDRCSLVVQLGLGRQRFKFTYGMTLSRCYSLSLIYCRHKYLTYLCPFSLDYNLLLKIYH